MELPCSKSEREEKEEKKIFGQGVHYCRWVGRKMTDVDRWMKSEYWHPLNCPWPKKHPLNCPWTQRDSYTLTLCLLCAGQCHWGSKNVTIPLKIISSCFRRLSSNVSLHFSKTFPFYYPLFCCAEAFKKILFLNGTFLMEHFSQKYLTFDHHRANSE